MASLDMVWPAAVQRKTKRLPAAKAAALAGSDGTATTITGVGFVLGTGAGAGPGIGLVAMLYAYSPYSICTYNLLLCRESIQRPLDGHQHGFHIGELLIAGFGLLGLRQIGTLDYPTAGLTEKGSR
jgi:hypothetical protein